MSGGASVAPRARLPARRPSVSRAVVWSNGRAEHRFHATVGFCPQTGRALEVFAGGKTGSDMAHVICDACVLISIALQHGASARALAHSLLKMPLVLPGGEGAAPASPVGAIVQALIELEEEMGHG